MPWDFLGSTTQSDAPSGIQNFDMDIIIMGMGTQQNQDMASCILHSEVQLVYARRENPVL